MKKNKKDFENKNLDDFYENISLENKIIEKSIDSQIDFDAIENAKAYYSERYGWTLKRN